MSEEKKQQHEQTLLDDIIEGLEGAFEEIGKLFNPQKRKPTRVPVPIRPDYPPQPPQRRDQRY